MLRKNEAPKNITLSDEEVDQLKLRIENNELTNKDLKIFMTLLAFNHWLQTRLARAKLTIKRLQNIFGFKSESKKKETEKTDDAHKKQEKSDNEQPTQKEKKQWQTCSGMQKKIMAA